MSVRVRWFWSLPANGIVFTSPISVFECRTDASVVKLTWLNANIRCRHCVLLIKKSDLWFWVHCYLWRRIGKPPVFASVCSPFPVCPISPNKRLLRRFQFIKRRTLSVSQSWVNLSMDTKNWFFTFPFFEPRTNPNKTPVTFKVKHRRSNNNVGKFWTGWVRRTLPLSRMFYFRDSIKAL